MNKFKEMIKNVDWIDIIGITISLAGLAVCLIAKAWIVALMWVVVLLQDFAEWKMSNKIKSQQETIEVQRKALYRQDELISSLETKLREKDAILYGEVK